MTLRTSALTGPDEGFVLPRPRVTERIALPASATGGQLSLMEVTVQPGGLLAPVHVHSDEDESLFVLEGTLSTRLGEEELTVGPRSALFAPRGLAHTFWNGGDTVLKMIMVITPGHLDGYFQGIPSLGSADGPPAPEQVAEHAAAYGMRLFPESLAELAERHGVTLM
jgi:mannose-6-phosphate isomerase-like protein (cupin superfamily)